MVPYIAGTYDEHRFRVVHGRSHLFEVTMGAEYSVDGHRVTNDDPMSTDYREDDLGEMGNAWTPIPSNTAEDIRLRLGTEPNDD